MSGHDAGQSHYILILCVCVSACVSLRECKDVEGNFPCVEKVCFYQCLCLVHFSSFLVMIIMSKFLRCQNIHAGIPCTG